MTSYVVRGRDSVRGVTSVAWVAAFDEIGFAKEEIAHTSGDDGPSKKAIESASIAGPPASVAGPPASIAGRPASVADP